MPISDISSSDLSSKTVPPISPTCPTCGKEMRLIGVVPTCDGAIYEYLCSNGDRLSWRPHHLKSSLAA
jgi:hypothetical protein